MIEIKDLLSRWSNVLLSKESQKAAVLEALSLVVGIKVKPEDVQVKNNTVYLNIRPIYKSEIFLKKEQIDIFLEKTLGQKIPKNIR